MSKVAFVSGATGYIAQHLIKLLLANNYEVVGSVRTKEKGEHLQKLFGSKFYYEVVSDLQKEHGFDNALEKHPKVEVFFHAASPVTFAEDDIQKNIIQPAIDGTVNALKAVKAHGKNVKRFVLTSSVVSLAALQDGFHGKVNEDSWNDVTPEGALANGFAGYSASKTFAEKAALKFVAEEKPHFTYTAVLPGYVFGPQAFDSEAKDTLNLTSELITQFLKLKPGDALPPLAGTFVDVRDIAKAHFIAGESKEANGKRLAVTSGPFAAETILHAIRKNFPQLQDKLPAYDAVAEKAALENVLIEDYSRTRAILKIDYIGIEKSVVDAISQVLKNN